MDLALPSTPKRYRTKILLSPPITPTKCFVPETDKDAERNKQQRGDLTKDVPNVNTDSDDEVLTYAADAKDIAEYFGYDFLDKPVPYLNICDRLPMTSPIDYAHIVDDDTGFTEDNSPPGIRLADGVATMLYRWNKPVLDLFLDGSTSYFELKRRESNKYLYDLVIARKGNEVRVGFYTKLPTDIYEDGAHLLEWDVQVRAKILPSGRWKVIFASRSGISDNIFGEYENEQLGYRYENPGQRSRVLEISRQLATAMITRKLWKKSDGAKLTLTVR